jgi:YcaO-like protein with predicted kinase domain
MLGASPAAVNARISVFAESQTFPYCDESAWMARGMELNPDLLSALEETTAKSYRNGTHRVCAPERTVERILPHMAAMGITRVANVTGLDHLGIPVVMVCRPNSRSISVSQGKGFGLADAKASGLMEALELFHAEHIDSRRVFESYARMRGRARVADLSGLIFRRASRYSPNLKISWIKGFDLLNRKPTWVPYALVHTDFRMPRKDSKYFLQSSNGLASGNHILEAVIHGICEVIERDATTLWTLDPHRSGSTRVQLETVDDAECQRVLNAYREAEIAVAVWNVTSDVGVPAFLCHIVPEYDDPFRRLYAAGGCGCHVSRSVALLRALLEAAQSRLTIVAGARDDIPRSEYLRHRSPRMVRRFRKQIQASAQCARFDDAPTFNNATLNEDLDFLLNRLRAAGIGQVIAVDLTKPEFRIPVVRIVIPHLEPISDSPKYLRGRRARMSSRGGR